MASLNRLNESEVAEWRERLVRALLSLRDGSSTFLSGVRSVVAVANEPHVRDSEFNLFIAIASETDHLPPEQTRSGCSPEWLAKCDLEAEQVQAFYGAEVQAKVADLLARYCGAANPGV